MRNRKTDNIKVEESERMKIIYNNVIFINILFIRLRQKYFNFKW